MMQETPPPEEKLVRVECSVAETGMENTTFLGRLEPNWMWFLVLIFHSSYYI